MPAPRQLVWFTLLTCCSGATSAWNDDALDPSPDRAEERSPPDSGFPDDDPSEPIPNRAEETPASDTGFSDLNAERHHELNEELKKLALPNNAPKPGSDQTEERPPPDSGFEDPDAPHDPSPDRAEERSPPDSGFPDDDPSEPSLNRAEEIPAPDSGFPDDDPSKPIPNRAEETPASDTGFSYLKAERHQALNEELKKLPLPNKKLLPHLTSKFATPLDHKSDYPDRFREAHIGGDKDLMDGVKLYRSAVPHHEPNTLGVHGNAMPSNNPPSNVGPMGAMPSGYVPYNLEYPTYTVHVNDVNFLLELNVKNVINLNPANFSPESLMLLQINGIRLNHIPIPDDNAPTLLQIKDAINSIETARRSGESSWIFCNYGDGRTGTIVAAYEIWKIYEAYPDLSSAELVTYVRRRSGYIKTAYEMFPDMARNYDLVNAYNTHKIENNLQVDSLLSFAEEISHTNCFQF